MVALPGHGIAYMGDLFPSKSAPVIDRKNGGSGLALVETLARAVRAITGVTRVVAGHDPGPPPGVPRFRKGDLQRWSDLNEYADFCREFVDAVQRAARDGKSVAEAANSLALPEKYKAYDMSRAEDAVAAIYDEIHR